jgi:hypothetical protein
VCRISSNLPGRGEVICLQLGLHDDMTMETNESRPCLLLYVFVCVIFVVSGEKQTIQPPFMEQTKNGLVGQTGVWADVHKHTLTQK